MNLTNGRIEALTIIPVEVSGDWLEHPKRDWQGAAIAPEPLVAVMFLKHKNIIEWCKSPRQSGEGLRVEFALSPYDKFNLEVQVYFSIERGYLRCLSTVNSPTYTPNIEKQSFLTTGEIIKFASIGGRVQIDLHTLFIAQRDVKFGRNGLWHIRPEIKEFLPLELASILECGRTGKITSDT